MASFPITLLARRVGEAAERIRAISTEMMERRAEMRQFALSIPEGECQLFLMYAHHMDEIASSLDGIRFQLEQERLELGLSPERMETVEEETILLADSLSSNQIQRDQVLDNEQDQKTTDDAINRFDNEGGRMPHQDQNSEFNPLKSQ